MILTPPIGGNRADEGHHLALYTPSNLAAVLKPETMMFRRDGSDLHGSPNQ